MISKFSSGLAHEINNPNSFVLSNLDYLQKQSILINKLTSHGLTEKEEKRLRQLQQFWPELVADSMQGASRIKNIIKALSPLNHCLDISMMKFDLVDCIQQCVRRFSMQLNTELIQLPDVCLLKSKKNVLFHCLEQIFNNSLQAYDNKNQTMKVDEKRLIIKLQIQAQSLKIFIIDQVDYISDDIFQNFLSLFH